MDPWSGRIPHAEGQLSQCSPTTVAHTSVARAPRQEKSPQREARIPQRRPPCSLEKAPAQHRSPSTAKKKFKRTSETTMSPPWFTKEGYHILLLQLLSCSVGSKSLQPPGLWPTRLLHPWNFPGKNIGVGCHSLLQGSCPTQGLNLGLLLGRQTLYH